MAEAVSKRSIFRDQALQRYRENREKSVLPRIIAPPVFLFFWILLVILTSAGTLAWLGEIPLYVTGVGVVLDREGQSDHNDDQAEATLLLSVNDASRVHKGLLVQVRIGSTGPEFSRQVDAVSSTVLSPGEVHRHYGIEVSDPAQVVVLKLGPGISRHVYAGSPVRAQIKVGTRRLLSLFPLFNALLKEV